MSLAIDLGSSEFRSLRWSGRCLIARRLPAEYVTLPNDANHQRLLADRRIEPLICDSGLIVLGARAGEIAQLCRIPVVPLLHDGTIPRQDPVGRQLSAAALDIIAPESQILQQSAVVVLPATSTNAKITNENAEFWLQLVKLRGYQPKLVNAGLAVVLGHLHAQSFTGIGISFGAASISACLARYGTPIQTATVPLGSRWMDEQLATRLGRFRWMVEGQMYLDLPGIQEWKCDARIDLNAPKTTDELLLAAIYQDTCRLVCEQIQLELDKDQRIAAGFQRPIPIAIAGGPTRVRGFRDVFAKAALESRLAIPISDIAIGDESPFNIARGALIALESGVQQTTTRRAS